MGVAVVDELMDKLRQFVESDEPVASRDEWLGIVCALQASVTRVHSDPYPADCVCWDPAQGGVGAFTSDPEGWRNSGRPLRVIVQATLDHLGEN